MSATKSKYGFDAIPDRLPCSNILRDRWYHFYELLKKSAAEYRYVCICDSKDVVFQSNPFDYVAKHFGDRRQLVLLFQEGMKHRDSNWNLIDQFEFQRDLQEYQTNDFKDWPVVNAGVVIGTPKEVAALCLLMWMTYTKTQGRCSDQAALNYLINNPLKDDGIHHSLSPHECPLVLTGEGVATNHIEVMFDGQAYNSELAERYSMFHQWERTGYRQAILDTYSF